MKSKTKNKIFSVLLVVQIVLVQILSKNTTFIERYYANGIYPYISKILRILFGWIPFSVGDIFIIATLFYFLFFVYKLVKNKFKNLSAKLLQVTAFLSVVYFCFYLFWGLNYFREPLTKKLKYKTSKYTTEQLINTTKLIVQKLNYYHTNIVTHDSIKVSSAYSTAEVYKKAVNGYAVIAKTYPKFKYTNKSIKTSLLSFLQTYNGVTGYVNPITGEAQINNLIPKTTLPSTTCHEMAHQIGFAAEDEANFIGFLASVNNPDNYFKYSGYKMAFSYCFSELKKRDSKIANMLWQTLHKGVKKDFIETSMFWQKYKNPIEPILKKGYNSYLKANKQSNGIKSYNYVVDLLISHFNINS